jgi:hypothetical protein
MSWEVDPLMCRMRINDFNDGLNYIKSDNNTIMLLVPGEHNYRQLSD